MLVKFARLYLNSFYFLDHVYEKWCYQSNKCYTRCPRIVLPKWYHGIPGIPFSWDENMKKCLVKVKPNTFP